MRFKDKVHIVLYKDDLQDRKEYKQVFVTIHTHTQIHSIINIVENQITF